MAELERSIDELIRGLTENYGHLCDISPRRTSNENCLSLAIHRGFVPIETCPGQRLPFLYFKTKDDEQR